MNSARTAQKDVSRPRKPRLRTVAGVRPCHRCGASAGVYAGDPRAQGWLRVECSNCGAWGDLDPRALGEEPPR